MLVNIKKNMRGFDEFDENEGEKGLCALENCMCDSVEWKDKKSHNSIASVFRSMTVMLHTDISKGAVFKKPSPRVHLFLHGLFVTRILA